MLKFFAKRRLNYIDGIGASIFASALTGDRLGAGILGVVLCAILSASVEHFAARQEPPHDR